MILSGLTGCFQSGNGKLRLVKGLIVYRPGISLADIAHSLLICRNNTDITGCSFFVFIRIACVLSLLCAFKRFLGRHGGFWRFLQYILVLGRFLV